MSGKSVEETPYVKSAHLSEDESSGEQHAQSQSGSHATKLPLTLRNTCLPS